MALSRHPAAAMISGGIAPQLAGAVQGIVQAVMERRKREEESAYRDKRDAEDRRRYDEQMGMKRDEIQRAQAGQQLITKRQADAAKAMARFGGLRGVAPAVDPSTDPEAYGDQQIEVAPEQQDYSPYGDIGVQGVGALIADRRSRDEALMADTRARDLAQMARSEKPPERQNFGSSKRPNWQEYRGGKWTPVADLIAAGDDGEEPMGVGMDANTSRAVEEAQRRALQEMIVRSGARRVESVGPDGTKVMGPADVSMDDKGRPVVRTPAAQAELESLTMAKMIEAGIHPTNFQPIGPNNPYRVPAPPETPEETAPAGPVAQAVAAAAAPAPVAKADPKMVLRQLRGNDANWFHYLSDGEKQEMADAFARNPQAALLAMRKVAMARGAK